MFKGLDRSFWDDVGVDLSVILPNQNVSQVTRYRPGVEAHEKEVKGGPIFGRVGNASSWFFSIYYSIFKGQGVGVGPRGRYSRYHLEGNFAFI